MARGESFPSLVAVMERLLAPDGCPWDREQTFESLKSYLLEEAHEAIDSGDAKHHREELGDLLFQVVFQAALARSQGRFDVDEVVAADTVRGTSWQPEFCDVWVQPLLQHLDPPPLPLHSQQPSSVSGRP